MDAAVVATNDVGDEGGESVGPEFDSDRWEVREVGVPRLGAFDPGPKTRPWLIVLVGLLYGPGFGVVTLFVARDQLFGEPTASDVVLAALFVVAYLLVGFLLAFYLLLNALRFRFDAEGVRVRTLFGHRSLRRDEVTRAYHRTFTDEGGGSHRLDLFAGRRRIGIPLDDYRKRASLVEAIRAALPVPIERDDRRGRHDLVDDR